MRDMTENDNWHLAGGHRVYFRRAGVGDPIVFLPNATLTGRLWEHQLGADQAHWVLPKPDRLAGHPPVCWIWGAANRLLPLEAARRQLEVLEPEEVHILAGCGYAAAWEAPKQVNQIIEGFLDRHAVPARGAAEAGWRP